MPSTIEHTQSEAASRDEVKSAAYYDASSPSSKDMVQGQANLFGNPFISRVEEASARVAKTEKRITMLKGQLRSAREQYAQDIAIYNEVIADLQSVKETGTVKGDVMPSCEFDARRPLRKDQRKAVRSLKDSVPEDLKATLRKYDWHVSRFRADETFEYMDLARKRQKALLRSDIEANRDYASKETLQNATVTQSISELAGEALTAGLAFQDRHWPKHIKEDQAELVTVHPRTDISAAHANPVSNENVDAKHKLTKPGFTATDAEWDEQKPDSSGNGEDLQSQADQTESTSDTNAVCEVNEADSDKNEQPSDIDGSNANESKGIELPKDTGPAKPQGP